MMMVISRGGSRTAATSKMESFVIIVNGFQPLTIITKLTILYVAAVLDPPLISIIIAITTIIIIDSTLKQKTGKKEANSLMKIFNEV